MITWHGRHGDFVRLQLLGYEYPGLTEDYDANWLRVGLEAVNEQGHWTRECSCLLTWEVHWLSQWLDKAPQGLVDPVLGLLEPDLSFRYIAATAERHCIAVCLAYDLGYERPQGHPRNTSVVVAYLSEMERQQALVDLAQAEKRLPARGCLGRQNLRDLPEVV